MAEGLQRMTTLYQENLVADFMREAFTAYRNQEGLDSAPLDSGDADLNEFVDTMTGSFIIRLHIPQGITKAEYIVDLREALHAVLSDIPEMKYDEELKNSINKICDHLDD